jgi:tetratricopeptide (TPR) repeat protein
MASKKQTLLKIRDAAVHAYREHRDGAAMELARVYLQHETDDAYMLYILGDTLRGIMRYGEAEYALLKSFDLAPNSRRAYPASRLAMLYEVLGRFAEAEQQFAIVSMNREWKKFGWLWILRGVNAMNREDLSMSEKCFRTALTLQNVDIDEAWLNLGLLQRAQRKYEESLQSFRKCLEIDPDCRIALECVASLESINNAMALAGSLLPTS